MVIGITGGVGSGKSLFSRELSKQGAYVIDADKVAQELIEKHKIIRDKIRQSFGPDIFDNKGNLQRKKLAEIVFSDKKCLQKLNLIMYSPLIKQVKNLITRNSKTIKSNIIIVDMAIIFEAGIESIFDYIVTIDAPLVMRIKWLKQNRNWSEKEIRQRIHSQMDVEEKIKKSDFVINNNGSEQDLALKAKKLYTMLKSINPISI